MVDESGSPIVGAAVRLRRCLSSDDSDRASDWRNSVELITGDEGRFEFRDVSRAVKWILCNAPGDLRDAKYVAISSLANLEAVELVIDPPSRKCHLKINRVGSTLAVRSFAVLDAEGDELDLYLTRNGWTQYQKRGAVRDAGSEVVGVSDVATTLVLYGDGDIELMRMPLLLVPGELKVIRL